LVLGVFENYLFGLKRAVIFVMASNLAGPIHFHSGIVLHHVSPNPLGFFARVPGGGEMHNWAVQHLIKSGAVTRKTIASSLVGKN